MSLGVFFQSADEYKLSSEGTGFSPVGRGDTKELLYFFGFV